MNKQKLIEHLEKLIAENKILANKYHDMPNWKFKPHVHILANALLLLSIRIF